MRSLARIKLDQFARYKDEWQFCVQVCFITLHSDCFNHWYYKNCRCWRSCFLCRTRQAQQNLRSMKWHVWADVSSITSTIDAWNRAKVYLGVYIVGHCTLTCCIWKFKFIAKCTKVQKGMASVGEVSASKRKKLLKNYKEEKHTGQLTLSLLWQRDIDTCRTHSSAFALLP